MFKNIIDDKTDARFSILHFYDRHNMLRRVLSLILVVTFLFQEIAFAQGPSGTSAPTKSASSKTDQPINLREFSIPRNLGVTKDVGAFDSKEVIINIKDAHDNLSAQESIVGILDNIVTNYEVKTVAVEGSFGYIDTSIISSFPDKEIKEKVAGELMAEGRISAAEYFSAINDPGIALYGIDDKDLHSKNMDAFRKALGASEESHKKAKALYDALAALEDRVYSGSLKVLEDNSVLKNNGNLGLTSRWDIVRGLGEKHGVKAGAFTNLNNLLKAIELEKKCDFKATNAEREALLVTLKDKLTKNKLEELILKSLSFKLGKISPSMFYSHLVDLARLEKMDMSKYPNITVYVEYMTLFESVDVGAIKDEIADYENNIKEKLFRNNEERTLASLLRKASVLSDLLEVKLTSKSLQYFKANRASFSAEEFAGFIRAMYRKYNMPIPAGLDITGVFDAIPPAEEFYELTLKRNDIMIANTIKRMRQRGETVAALVTGGFHTEGITELLKSDRLSYIVILPKMDKDKKRPYLTIITNKQQSYQKLIDGGEFYIALANLLDLDGDEGARLKFSEYIALRMLNKTLKINSKMSPQKVINLIREYQENQENQEKNKLSLSGLSEEDKGKIKEEAKKVRVILEKLKNNFRKKAGITGRGKKVREEATEAEKAAAEKADKDEKAKTEQERLAKEAAAAKLAEAVQEKEQLEAKVAEEAAAAKAAQLAKRLEQTDTLEKIALLTQALADEDSEVRLNAALALWNQADEGILPKDIKEALIKRISKDENGSEVEVDFSVRHMIALVLEAHAERLLKEGKITDAKDILGVLEKNDVSFELDDLKQKIAAAEAKDRLIAAKAWAEKVLQQGEQSIEALDNKIDSLDKAVVFLENARDECKTKGVFIPGGADSINQLIKRCNTAKEKAVTDRAQKRKIQDAQKALEYIKSLNEVIKEIRKLAYIVEGELLGKDKEGLKDNMPKSRGLYDNLVDLVYKLKNYKNFGFTEIETDKLKPGDVIIDRQGVCYIVVQVVGTTTIGAIVLETDPRSASFGNLRSSRVLTGETFEKLDIEKIQTTAQTAIQEATPKAAAEKAEREAAEEAAKEAVAAKAVADAARAKAMEEVRLEAAKFGITLTKIDDPEAARIELDGKISALLVPLMRKLGFEVDDMSLEFVKKIGAGTHATADLFNIISKTENKVIGQVVIKRVEPLRREGALKKASEPVIAKLNEKGEIAPFVVLNTGMDSGGEVFIFQVKGVKVFDMFNIPNINDTESVNAAKNAMRQAIRHLIRLASEGIGYDKSEKNSFYNMGFLEKADGKPDTSKVFILDFLNLVEQGKGNWLKDLSNQIMEEIGELPLTSDMKNILIAVANEELGKAQPAAEKIARAEAEAASHQALAPPQEALTTAKQAATATPAAQAPPKTEAELINALTEVTVTGTTPRIASLILHLQKTRDTEIIKTLIYLAKKDKDNDNPVIRQNARKVLRALLGIDNIDVEQSPLNTKDQSAIIEAYALLMSGETREEDLKIFDGIMDSAFSEDSSSDVHKNFAELEEILGTIGTIEDGNSSIDKEMDKIEKLLVEANKLAINLKSGDEIYELEAKIGRLLNLTEEKKEEELKRTMAGILDLIGQLKQKFTVEDMPPSLLELIERIDGLNSKLQSFFGNAKNKTENYQKLRQNALNAGIGQSPVAEETGEARDEKTDKGIREELRARALEGIRKALSRESILGAISVFFGNISIVRDVFTNRALKQMQTARTKAISNLQKSMGGTLQSTLEEINQSRDIGNKLNLTKNFEQAIAEIIKALFKKDQTSKEARDIILQMVKLHKVYEKNHRYLRGNDAKMKEWGSWFKSFIESWEEAIIGEVPLQIEGYLGNLASKGEELKQEIITGQEAMKKDKGQLEKELKDATEQLEKNKESLSKGYVQINEKRKQSLSLKDRSDLEKNNADLADAIKQLRKEIDPLEKLLLKLTFALQVIEKGMDSGGTLDESIKIGLKGDLMAVFVRQKIRKVMGSLKKTVRERIFGTDSKPGILVKSANKKYYTAKSMKKAKESIDGFERFLLMACVDLTMRQIGGFTEGMYEVQVLGGLLCADGYIINAPTGEGKTEVSIIPLGINALTGLTAIAETSNLNLARKDHLSRNKVFNFMGFTSELCDSAELNKLSPAERQKRLKQLFGEREKAGDDGVDIVTIATDEFNFLLSADLVEMGAAKLFPRGMKWLSVIIDEIDASVRATSTRYLIAGKSKNLKEENPGKYEVVRRSVGLAHKLILTGTGRELKRKEYEGDEDIDQDESSKGYLYAIDRARGITTITDRKAVMAQCREVALGLKVSAEEIYDWVEKSIDMIETYKIGVHYAIVDGEVKLVGDGGRVDNRRLSDGRHTVLEMYLKEFAERDDVTVYDDSVSAAELGGGVARTKYFCEIGGMSATALSSELEIAHIYDYPKGIVDIPAHFVKKNEEMRPVLTNGAGDKRAMLEQFIKSNRYGEESDYRPAITFIRKSDVAHQVKDVIRAQFPELTIQVIDGELEKGAWDAAMEQSEKRNVITIITDAGARGNDYKLLFRNIGTMDDASIAGSFSRLFDVLGEDASITELRNACLDKNETEIMNIIQRICNENGFQRGSSEYKELMLIQYNMLRVSNSVMTINNLTIAINGQIGSIKLLISKEAKELKKILLDANLDDNRKPEAWVEVERRFNYFFNELEGRVKDDAEKLKKIRDFRRDVMARYMQGYAYCGQLSDRSIGDVLQEIGRVGRQADPATIMLFVDISDESDDLDILNRGFDVEHNDERYNEAMRDIMEYRKLDNKRKSPGTELSKAEKARLKELRQKIVFDHFFGALLEQDLNGQNSRIKNDKIDRVIYDEFNRMALAREQLIDSLTEKGVGLEIALKWLDEIVQNFSDSDETKIKKLKGLFVLAFGEDPEFMDGFEIHLDGGGVLTLGNLKTDNQIKIFAEMLKALIGAKKHDELSPVIKAAVTQEEFNRLAGKYNAKTLLTERFTMYLTEAVTALMQYDFFKYVGGLRSMDHKAVASRLHMWVSVRIRDMQKLMPGRMINILFDSMRNRGYLREEYSNAELDKARAAAAEQEEGIIKATLKKVAGKVKTNAGKIVTGIGAGAATGAAVGSLLPGIGTIIGTAAGALTGGLLSFIGTKIARRLGWKRMILDEKFSKLRTRWYTFLTSIKYGIEGIAPGAMIGAAGGAILGGIIGALVGGVGVLPGMLAGFKAGGLLGLKLGIIGVAVLGFATNAVYGWYKVFHPGTVQTAVAKSAARKKAEAEETASIVEVRHRAAGAPHEPLFTRTEHVKEPPDTYKQFEKLAFGEKNGMDSEAIRRLLAGESKPRERLKTEKELKKEMNEPREIRDEDGRVIGYVVEVNPEIGDDGKPVAGSGAVSAAQRVAAFNMFKAFRPLPPVPEPPPPVWICVPAGVFISQNQQGDDKDKALRDLIINSRKDRGQNEQLCIFTNGPSQDVHVMSFDMAQALSESARTSRVAVDFAMSPGKNIAMRKLLTGEIVLTVKCDNGDIVYQKFGSELSESDKEIISRAISFATASAKGSGTKKVKDYNSPEAEKMRKKAGEMAARMGLADDDVEIALQDPLLTNMLNNGDLSGDDIEITAKGIFVNNRVTGNRDSVILFGISEINLGDAKAPAEVKAPEIVKAFPQTNPISRLMMKLSMRLQANMGNAEYWIKNLGLIAKLIDKLKDHPTMLKAVDKIIPFISGLCNIHLILAVFVLGLPDVVSKKAEPWVNDKFDLIIKWRKGKPKPDQANMLELYKMPGADSDQKTLCKDWVGNEDADIIRRMRAVCKDRNNPRGYFDLAELLRKKAEEAERHAGKKEAKKLYALAEKFSFIAVNLDKEKTAEYYAALARIYHKQGKDDAALEQIRYAMKYNIKGEERNRLLYIQAEILGGKGKFGQAIEVLRKISTRDSDLFDKRSTLQDDFNKKWKELEEKSKAEKESPWASLAETAKEVGTWTKTNIKTLITGVSAVSATLTLGLMLSAGIPITLPLFLIVFQGISMSVIPYLSSAIIIIVYRVIIVKWILGAVKAGKQYSIRKSRIRDLKDAEGYASRHRMDVRGRIRLIQAYIANGDTKGAMQKIREAVNLFPALRYKKWREDDVLATRFAISLLDLDIGDKDREQAFGIISDMEQRIQDQEYRNIVAAKLALKKGNLNAAENFIRAVSNPDLQSDVDTDVYFLKLDILQARLKEETTKSVGERNKTVIDNIVTKIAETLEAIDSKSAGKPLFGFSDKEKQRLGAIRIEAEKLQESLEARRVNEREPEFKAVESGEIVKARAEKEEAPKTDEKELLKRAIERDRFNHEDRIKLAAIYLGTGDYAEAQALLQYILDNAPKGEDVVSRAAELVVIARLIGGGAPERPGLARTIWHYVHNLRIKSPLELLAELVAESPRKNVIQTIINLQKGRKIDVDKFVEDLEKLPSDGSKVSTVDGYLLQLGISALIDYVSALKAKGSEVLRRDSLRKLHTLGQVLKGKAFEDEKAGEKALALLTADGLSGLTQKIVEDVKAEKDNTEKESEISNLIGRINALKDEIAALEEAAKKPLTFFQNQRKDQAVISKKKKEEELADISKELEKVRVKVIVKIAAESDPLVLAKQVNDLFARQEQYIELAGSEMKYRRERCLTVIDELMNLLNKHGDNDELRKAVSDKLDTVVGRYVETEKAIAEAAKKDKPAESDEYKKWKNMTNLRKTMNDLEQKYSANKLYIILRLKLISRYFNIMLARDPKDRQDTPIFGLDHMVTELLKGLDAIMDSAVKEAAINEVMAIVEGQKGVSAGKKESEEYFIDKFITAVKNNVALEELLMKAVELRLSDSRDNKKLVEWAKKYARKRILNIASEKEEKERKKKLQDFKKWFGGIPITEDKGVVNAVIDEVVAILDITIRLEFLEAISEFNNIPPPTEQFINIITDVNSAGKIRERALTKLQEIIGKMEKDIPVAILLRMAKKLLLRTLTEDELVEVHNLLIALKKKLAKDDLNIKKIDLCMEPARKKIEAARKARLNDSRKSKFKAMMAVVGAKIALANTYEEQGGLDKARAELEEANKILNDDMDVFTKLQRDDKADDYGGDFDQVVKTTTSILLSLEGIREKQDTIDSDWYVSRAMGEIHLARCYIAMREYNKADSHVEIAFKHLEEAQTRDPKNAKLKPVFGLARLERIRAESARVAQSDITSLLKRREDLRAERAKLVQTRRGAVHKIIRLSKEIAALEILSVGKECSTAAEKQDLADYEATAGISAKKEERQKVNAESERLKGELEKNKGKLDLIEVSASDNLSKTAAPAGSNLGALISASIDVILNGQDSDDDVKEVTAFLKNVAGKDAGRMKDIFQVIDKKREEISNAQKIFGRQRGEKELLILRDLEFDIIYKHIGKKAALNAILMSLGDDVALAERDLDKADFLEYILDKFSGYKKALIAELQNMAENAVDGMLKTFAKEKLLDLIFDLVGLKASPDLFKDKTKDEIKELLYKALGEKLSETGKTYEASKALLDLLVPLIRQVLEKLKEKGKKWHDLDVFERRLLLAELDKSLAQDEKDSVKDRMIQLEVNKYNGRGFVELGKRELGKGDLFAALSVFDKALALAPDMAEAKSQKAGILQKLGRPLDAAKLLKEASDKDPENEDALILLRNIYIETKDGIKRSEVDEKLYALYMKKAESADAEGSIKNRDKLYEKALECAQDEALARPRLAAAKARAVQALVRLGEFAKAQGMIDAIEASTDNFLLARGPWFKRKVKEGQRSFGLIITGEDVRNLVESRAKIHIALAKNKMEAGEDAKQDAKAAVVALNKYKKFLKNSAVAHNLFAGAYGILGDKKKTRKYLDRAIAAEKMDVHDRWDAMLQYDDMDDFRGSTKAIELAEGGIKSDAVKKDMWRQEKARLLYNRSLLKKDRREKGAILLKRQLEDLAAALEIRRSSNDAAVISESLRFIVERREAIAKELKAMKVKPDVRAALSVDLIRLALDIIDISVSKTNDQNVIDKEVAKILLLVDELNSLQNTEDTPKDARNKIRLTLSEAHRIQADQLLTKTDIPGALKLYKDAVMGNPKNYKAHYGLAKVYEGMKDYELAALHLEEAKKDNDIEGKDRVVTMDLIRVYGVFDPEKAVELDKELKKTRIDTITQDKKDRLNKAEEEIKSINELGDKYLRLEAFRDKLQKRAEKERPRDKAEKSDKIKEDDVVDAESILAGYTSQNGKINLLGAHMQTLLTDIITKIAGRPETEQKLLIERLVGKLSSGDADMVISRLISLKSLITTKKMKNTNLVLIALARSYIQKNDDAEARKVLADIIKTGPLKVEAHLLLCEMDIKKKEYSDALEELKGAIRAFNSIWNQRRDDRMRSRIAQETTRVVHELVANKIGVDAADIEIILKVLKDADSFEAIGDLILIAVRPKINKLGYIADLISDASIPDTQRKKIIDGFAALVKLDSSAIKPMAEVLIPVIEKFNKRYSSQEGWELLSALYRAAGRTFALWKNKLLRKPKAPASATHYYDLGKAYKGKGKYKEAAANLKKAMAINPALRDDAEFKKDMVEAHLKMAEAMKEKTEKDLKTKKAVLNDAAGFADYEAASYATVRNELIQVSKRELELYESGRKDIKNKYPNAVDRDRARIEALMTMARLHAELLDFDNAAKCYNDILNIDKDHREALAGLESLGISRTASTKATAAGKNFTDDTRNEYLAESLKERANNEKTDLMKKQEHINKAVQLAPEDEELYLMRAEVLRDMGEFEKAREAIANGVKIAEKKNNDKVKEGLEEILTGIDEIDAFIYGVIDRDIALRIINLLTEIQLIPDSQVREAKLKELNSLRGRLSGRARASLDVRRSILKFREERQGRRDDLTPQVMAEIQRNVESVLAKFAPVSIPANDVIIIARLVIVGERLLSENRLDDLEELLYQADLSGVKNDQLELLQAKRLIALAKGIVMDGKQDWEQEVAGLEHTIKVQADIIAAPDQKAEVMIALARFHIFMADRTRDAAGKRSAFNNAATLFKGALYADPFSLDALKGLSAIKDTEKEAADRVKNILNNKGLKDRDEKYKNELMSFIINSWPRWTKLKAEFKLKRNHIVNLGEISISIDIQLIDFVFANGFYDLIPKILGKTFATLGQQIAIVKALNRNLASLRLSQLRTASGFADIATALEKFSAKGRAVEESILNAEISIARAFLNIGTDKFTDAAINIMKAEKSTERIMPLAAFVRAKLSVAESKGIRPWSFAGLSSDARRIIALDMAKESKISPKMRINELRSILGKNADDVEAHIELKDAYDSIKRFNEALYEAIAIMQVMMEQGDYEGAAAYYNENIDAAIKRGQYENYADLLRRLSAMKKKADEAVAAGKQTQAARVASVTPSPVVENIFTGEFFRHVIQAPIKERVIYFGIPLIAVFLPFAAVMWHGGAAPAVAMLGLIPLGGYFNITFAIIQLFFAVGFIKKHEDGKWAAGIVSVLCMGLLYFNMSPVALFMSAWGIHAGTNLVIFAVNSLSNFAQIGYATIAPSVPTPPAPPMAAIPANIVIGIIVTEDNKNEVNVLKAPPGVQFIPVKDKAEFDEAAVAKQAASRILIDFADLNAIALDDINKIADAESIKSFIKFLILTYPYMRAWSKDNLSQLNHDSLKDMLVMIVGLLPQAESLDLNKLDLNNILSKVFKPSKPISGLPVPVPLKAKETIRLKKMVESEKWVEEYTKALQSDDETNVKKKQGELMRYLDSIYESPDKMHQLIARHDAMITAQYWEAEENKDQFSVAEIDDINKEMKEKNKTAVFVIDEIMLRGKALYDFEKLVADLYRGGKKPDRVKIVVFGKEATSAVKFSDVELHKHVQYMQRDKSTSIVSQIGEQFKDDVCIGIATVRGGAESLEDIRDGLKGLSAPAFVIMENVEDGELLNKYRESIIKIFTSAVLYSAKTNKKFFAGVGTLKGEGIDAIQEYLKKVNGFYMMFTNVGKAIAEIFNAIKKTAISA